MNCLPKTRSKLCLLGGLCLLTSLAGCSATLVGDWRLAQVSPSRAEFCLEDVSFTRDGRFAATVTLDGRTARESGAYDFSGFHLTLRPAAGGQRRYDAQLKVNRLEVRRGGSLVVLTKGKSRNATPPPPREPPPKEAVAPQKAPPARVNELQVIREGTPPGP